MVVLLNLAATETVAVVAYAPSCFASSPPSCVVFFFASSFFSISGSKYVGATCLISEWLRVATSKYWVDTKTELGKHGVKNQRWQYKWKKDWPPGAGRCRGAGRVVTRYVVLPLVPSMSLIAAFVASSLLCRPVPYQTLCAQVPSSRRLEMPRPILDGGWCQPLYSVSPPPPQFPSGRSFPMPIRVAVVNIAKAAPSAPLTVKGEVRATEIGRTK